MAGAITRRAMWAGLSAHLVNITSKFLRSAADFLRFRSVCRSWRSALPLSRCHLPPQLPILLVISAFEDWITFRLTGDSAGHCCRTGIFAYISCLGSSYGWLILFHEGSKEVSLFNPYTAEAIPLPSLTPLLDKIEQENGNKPDDGATVEHALLSSDPTLHRDFVVIVFLEAVHLRCVTCRPGERSWTANPNSIFLDLRLTIPGEDLSFPMMEVVPYGEGRLCAIYGDNRYWAVLGVDPGPPGRVKVTAWGRLPSCVPHTIPSALVPSAGELLLVTWCHERTANATRDLILRVFRFDPGEMGREAVASEVEDIGDRMLFLGKNHSVSVAARDFTGFQGNAIYYVDYELILGKMMTALCVFRLRSSETAYVFESNELRFTAWWASANLRSYNGSLRGYN